MNMKTIRFVCDGEAGVIDHSGFVRWSGVGFHLQDVRFDKESNLVKTLRIALKGSPFEIYLR